MSYRPFSVHSVDCDCSGCYSGRTSSPFDRNGDPAQFHMLLHDGVVDNTSEGDLPDWMAVAAEYCPERFAEWIAGELRARRLLSRSRVEAKAAAAVLGNLFDD